jgi:hypothetical protein
MWRILFTVLCLIGAGACGQPDCEKVCVRTLPCNLTFAPGDDPQLRKVESGERTAQGSCEQGCRESLTVDENREQCLLAVTTQDVGRCRAQLLECLGSSQDAN